jgi:arylsulfatase A-like enzyme
MTIYPTLTDLAGLETPTHVEGKSIRPLLATPNADWQEPAITTHELGNHAVRTGRWRYIRYAGGGEELYDEQSDPYEWKNLAHDAKAAAVKSQLASLFPDKQAPDLSSSAPGRGKAKRKQGLTAD